MDEMLVFILLGCLEDIRQNRIDDSIEGIVAVISQMKTRIQEDDHD